MTCHPIVINKLSNWHKIHPVILLILTIPDSQPEPACLAKRAKNHGKLQALCSENCIFLCVWVDDEFPHNSWESFIIALLHCTVHFFTWRDGGATLYPPLVYPTRYCRSQFALGHPSDIFQLQDLTNCLSLTLGTLSFPEAWAQIWKSHYHVSVLKMYVIIENKLTKSNVK